MDEYRPMVALNVYLEPYFRKDILHKILDNLSKIPEDQRKKFLEAGKQHLRISGFRNPMAAPEGLLVRNAEPLMEKNSRFLSVVLETWAANFTDSFGMLKADLKQLGFSQVDAESNYEDPENAFLEGWPEGLTYTSLEKSVRELSPEITLTRDELCLLTIWLTGYLPGSPARV